MRRLFLFLLASLCLHLLILVPFFLFRNPLPLSGGGEVSIEIVGDDARGSQLAGPAEAGRQVGTAIRSQPTASGERRAITGSGTTDGTDPLLAEIRARIEQAKRYPLLARRSEIEGIALIGFQIDASGQPESVRLKSSSGHPMLDDEALATIQRAAPFPPYSKPLEIGIRFELKP